MKYVNAHLGYCVNVEGQMFGGHVRALGCCEDAQHDAMCSFEDFQQVVIASRGEIWDGRRDKQPLIHLWSQDESEVLGRVQKE